MLRHWHTGDEFTVGLEVGTTAWITAKDSDTVEIEA